MSGWTNWIQIEWQRPKQKQSLAFRAVTQPISSLYRRVVQRPRIANQRLQQPVISIGNLRVGGTGKTPVTAAIAAFLTERDMRCGILSRGYGAGLKSNQWFVLHKGAVTAGERPEFLPDEPVLLSQVGEGVPVVCGAKRWRAAQAAISAGLEPPDVWLLDDGFQHQSLARDIDIVLLDGTAPFANGCLLPAGPLRELPDSLHRASDILFSQIAGKPESLPVELHVFEAKVHAFQLEGGAPHDLRGESVWRPTEVDLVTAVARPERVIANLEATGGIIRSRIILSDHQRFAEGALTSLAGPVVTTAKDYSRQPKLFDSLKCDVFILPWNANLPASWLESLFTRVHALKNANHSSS